MLRKLTSLTIFFPFYNDAGTVKSMITQAFKYGPRVSKSLEVIALHGGSSQDDTWTEILKMKKKFPRLRVLNKSRNTEGYAVIKHGFKAARHEWVFYTDGDAQYYMRDLQKLVKEAVKTNADLVNGYKVKRHDDWYRRFCGSVFQVLHRLLTHSPIRDIHCDFRLVRRKYVKKIHWQTTGATIISELILKLDALNATFAEVEIKHRERKYGRSNYSVMKLCIESSQEIFWSLLYRCLTIFYSPPL